MPMNGSHTSALESVGSLLLLISPSSLLLSLPGISSVNSVGHLDAPKSLVTKFAA